MREEELTPEAIALHRAVSFILCVGIDKLEGALDGDREVLEFAKNCINHYNKMGAELYNSELTWLRVIQSLDGNKLNALTRYIFRELSEEEYKRMTDRMLGMYEEINDQSKQNNHETSTF